MINCSQALGILARNKEYANFYQWITWRWSVKKLCLFVLFSFRLQNLKREVRVEFAQTTVEDEGVNGSRLLCPSAK